MNLPTPESDPSGLAALVALFVSAIFAAVGVAADVAQLWVAVAVGLVNLVAFVWTRRKAWAPTSVAAVIDTTARNVRTQVVSEVQALAKPKRTRKV